MKKYRAFRLEDETYFTIGENEPKRECMNNIYCLMNPCEEDQEYLNWSDEKLERVINSCGIEIEEYRSKE